LLKIKKLKIEEAKKDAAEIFRAIVSMKIPVDELIVRFFIEKEDRIVEWLRELQFQCAIIPDSVQSMIAVYSTNRDHLTQFTEMIKNKLGPLVLDSSLIDYVKESNFQDFINELKEDDEIVFSTCNNSVKICGFDEKRDSIYTNFLKNLPMKD
jgi:hypothetical protein